MKTYKRIEAPDLETNVNLIDDDSQTEVGGIGCQGIFIVGIILDRF